MKIIYLYFYDVFTNILLLVAIWFFLFFDNCFKFIFNLSIATSPAKKKMMTHKNDEFDELQRFSVQTREWKFEILPMHS